MRVATSLLVGFGLTVCACGTASASSDVLAVARRLDATEPPPLMEPPAVGRRWADRNGDGALDPDEWLDWEWGGVLRREDRNHDGRVSQPEWLAAKCNFRLAHSGVCVRIQSQQFGRLDRNRDGQVGRAEWSVVSMSWFVQNDRNRDCRITPPVGEPRAQAVGPLWPCRPRPSR
jgi:hypothetical protein